ncbi:TetR/AcrR family transcriptional regulator [Blastococcus deserti]|uniref:TetR/AcrR family transcriptional regulator n=1 Tax=Blastococcus deserti TaxID=2259033 RepID=A0ABW4XCL9_9ACTN
MPRVSAEHLAVRRDHIVAAALRCFARDGFHATSVRDVVRESGLSAGAVYSYFRSKDDLVAAAVEPVVEGLLHAVDEAVLDRGASPGEVVGRLLERIYPLVVEGDVDYTRIAVTAWAEGLRDPAVRGIAQRTYGRVRERLSECVAHWRDAGHLPNDTDPEVLGQLLFSVVVGFVMQHALLGDVDPHRYAAAATLLLPPAHGGADR